MLLKTRHRSSLQTTHDSFLSELEVDRIISSCNLTLAKVTSEHDEIKVQIQDYKASIDYLQKSNIQQEKQLKVLKSNLDDKEYVQNIKNDVLKKLNGIEDNMGNLEKYLEEIQQITQEIESSPIMWKCIRCGFAQKEGQNEASCTYHPGKLKYFSCRLCGQDEYFTCCNRCRDCLYGCTKGLHKP
ncbi:unnamed protein product (macronuclear) [Paramecium tetraurelia]|uniref:Uncharacterized protein n=1 Tax=Paramecium tetraurelia TaxID=5888 RepID=A0DA63_PARTE|nr:uncharacterized protein GSPATT00014837001 [Paramecium tetraurelia]CAK79930.1 unnamed protein product [Paramecium tetraurelia]|eukprot:XP_001447327.1 hypothetical protein (macronuclear) [Paramecium tetraurelia strain d4-2]